MFCGGLGWSGVLSLGSLIGGLGDNLLGGHSDTPGSGVGDVGLVYLCILFFQCISSKHYLPPPPPHWAMDPREVILKSQIWKIGKLA